MSLRMSMTLESYDEQHVGRIADLRCECEIWSVHAKSRHAAAPLDATYEWTSILITEEYL